MVDAYVFSFNRGEFLENCLKSFRTCAPDIKVTVIDDNSTDPHTIDVLSRLQDEIQVIQPQNAQTETKTGGLYGNMNAALEIAHEANLKYVLFIQDDMQLVRSLRSIDFEMIENFFEFNRNVVQYQTCFRRRDTSERLGRLAFLDASKTAFFLPDDVEGGKDNFSATGIFHVSRMKERLDKFVIGEGANSERCRDLGIKKGLSSYPFMNWLPYPRSFRGKKRSATHSAVEYFGGAGFHPITIMQDSKIDSFLDKKASAVPVAEEWLSAPTAPRQDYWSTGGGEYNLVARGGFLALAVKTRKNYRCLISKAKK